MGFIVVCVICILIAHGIYKLFEIEQRLIMKNKFLLALMALALATQFSYAQKPEEYQNSYNYKRAMELLQNEEDEGEALKLLQSEVREHPKNGYAYYWICCLHDNNKRAGLALEAVNKAVELLMKDKEWISYAYRMRAKIYLSLDKDGKALEDWNLSLKANPKDIQTLSDRGEYYYRKQQYVLSDKDYENITSIEPANALGYMGKGRNALAVEDFEKAKDLFSYVLKLDPEYVKAYSFRAECYRALKKYNEATDDLIVALAKEEDKAWHLAQNCGEEEAKILLTKMYIRYQINKNDMMWPAHIAMVYESMSKYVQAIDYYKIVAKLDVSDWAFARMSHCYKELGIFELALEQIELAIALDSTNCDYVAQKGDLLYDVGDVEAAIQTYGKYIECNPESYGGYYRRGFMKDNSNDVDGAIEGYSTCIVLSPDFVYAYLGRGDKYLLKGNKALAIADYKKVVAMDTVYSENNCAQYAYLGLGEKDKAVAFMNSILARSPSAGNCYDAACLYARMGDKDSSLAYLRRSLEKGFRRLSHIERDDDLEAIRSMDAYKSLLDEYREKARRELLLQHDEWKDNSSKKEYVSEIPFTKEGGVCKVKCNINGLPLHFVFDTGASDVSISMVEATFMMKNGYLSKNDVMGKEHYVDANGNVTEGTILNLRNVYLGDLSLENVKASVVRNQKAPLLLGQSVLARLGKFEVDNENRVLKIKYFK